MMLNNIDVHTTLQQPRIIKTVVVVLIILLIISVVQLIQVSMKPMQTPTKEEVVAAEQSQAFKPSPLFGVSPKLGLMQQTRLNLTLKGTFSASSSTAGAAVITAPNASDKVYIVGETVPGGAIIREIEADYIVLEYEGNREILRLPQGKRLTSQ